LFVCSFVRSFVCLFVSFFLSFFGGGGKLWLEGFPELETTVARSKVRLEATVRHLGETAMLRDVRALARLCVLYTGFVCYTLAFALQLGNKALKKPQSGYLKSASWARFVT
jgi:cytochrome c biogenesis factor